MSTAISYAIAPQGAGGICKANSGEIDQVLLQWVYTEAVPDLEVLHSAAGAVGTHHELALLTVKSGSDSKLAELGVVKIPEHGVATGCLHGQVVMRSAPAILLLAMAFGAGFAADVTAVFRGKNRSREKNTDPQTVQKSQQRTVKTRPCKAGVK